MTQSGESSFFEEFESYDKVPNDAHNYIKETMF